MARSLMALALSVAWLTASAAPLGASSAHLVVITGLGGEPRFDERFSAWAATLLDSAQAGGLEEDRLIYLAGDPSRDARAKDRSTRDNVRQTLTKLASKSTDAPLFVVVIGHGSYRDGVFKVNLPGPDMTAADFSQSLTSFGDRPIVFANLTSASGELIRELSAPGRVVITATRSGTERNASVFAQFFAAAFVDAAADANHDGRLSVLEAFDYARSEVEKIYQRGQKLQTEHAVLDDNGDGEGSPEPRIDAEDGRLAASLTLTDASAALTEAANEDPDLARLYQQKAEWVQEVADLRLQKTELSPEAYEQRLEEILIELALINRAIHDRESSEDSDS